MRNIIKTILVCLALFHGGAAQISRQDVTGGELIQAKFDRIRSEIKGDSDEPGFKAGKETAANIKPMDVGEINTGSFLKMIFGLIFIIFLVILSIRGLKKFQNSSLVRKRSGKQEYMEVLETCYLGNNQKVVVLRIQGSTAALGVTPNGINMLKELALPPVEQIVPVKTSGGKAEQSEAFSNNLNYFLRKFAKPKTVEQTLREL